jgi:hypothetical protein
MRRLLLIATAASLAACDRPVNLPTELSSPDNASFDAVNETGVVQSASGGAIRFSGGEPFILTFEASRRSDGTLQGRYHVNVMRLDAKFDVVVTCMSIDDNRAWIGGVIEKSNNPLVVNGSASYFYAIDNAAGANGGVNPPDIISGLILNDTPGNELTFCNDQQLTIPSRAIDDGNIRIRG